MGTAWAGLEPGGTREELAWEGLEGVGMAWERLCTFLVAAFRRMLLITSWGQGKSCLGENGPRRSLAGREWVLEILPPMAHKALCRPLATFPLMAILELIMAIKLVMP